MNKLFEELIGAFGVSGHEAEVREVIVEHLNSLEVENKVDNLGNVIAYVGRDKEKERTMVVAHMDTMGFIVLHVEDSGFLRIGKVGEFEEAAFVNTIVEFENGNCGRVCTSKKDGSINDMYIDLGVSSKEEALELVKEGDVCIITSTVIEEEKNYLAPALDNRVGCYILLKAIEELKKNEINKNLVFVFSTQNNLGGRGARAAAYTLEPTYCLVVDAEAAEDSLGESGKLSLGKGTGIKFMDRSMVIHHEVKEKLEAVYESLEKKPTLIFSEEHSDGKTIHKEGIGVKTGTMVYPVRYKNTNIEMVNYSDIEEGIKVVYSYCVNC